MSFLDSLGIDAFGFSIVFAVLIVLSLIIKLISIIISKIERKAIISKESRTQDDVISAISEAQYGDGELKLYDVDEKTAALIMAIVSDESKIPLAELQFKSIRLMKLEARVK